MEHAEIGIVGGSGLYEMAGLEERREVEVDTPFGKPSDAFVLGNLEGRRVAFLARHGRGHRLLPSELNYRANIFALKKLGVRKILSASAVGSLKLELQPLDFVLPDQFVDRTTRRVSTFFGDGLAAHINFADPVCPSLLDLLQRASDAIAFPIKRGGTYLCIEGPAFSTRAESRLYQSWGMHLIGMTNLQEAKLSREAEICYVSIAMVTDYDCWHDDEESVTVEMLIGYLNQNSANAKILIREAVRLLDPQTDCNCHRALQKAMITDPAVIPPETLRKLRPIVGKYLEKKP